MMILVSWLNKLKKLWQSKNKNYKDFRLVGVVFILLAIFCMGFVKIAQSQFALIDIIAKYLIGYMSVILFLLGIAFLITYGFVFNKIKLHRFIASILAIGILGYMALIIVLSIPMLGFLGIIQKVVSYRAKKLDNIIVFFEALSICLVVVTLLLYVSVYVSSITGAIITNHLNIIMSNLFENNPMVIHNVFTVQAMIFLLLEQVEAMIVFNLSLFIIKKNRISKHKKVVAMKEEVIDSKYNSSTTIDAHITKKQNEINQMNKDFEEKLTFDLIYYKNTLKRIELGFLIFVFLLCVFKIYPHDFSDEFNTYSSDIINIITVYTLGMLFLDKSAQWK